MALPSILTTPRLPILVLPLLCFILIPLHFIYVPPPIHIPHFITDPLATSCTVPFEQRHPTPPSHPIMILQHFSYHDPKLMSLSLSSMISHQRYAQAHGYLYRADESNYVPSKWSPRRRSMNKIYALLNAVLDELSKGDDGVGWIMYAK